MARTINLEGNIIELPDAGFVNPVMPLQNDHIIGLSLLFIIFSLTLPWGAFFAALPALGIDTWTGIAIFLILLLRFVSLVIRQPLGANVKAGFYGGVATSHAAFFWELLGDMAITVAFCVLVLLKNPLVFAFIIVLLIGRFRTAGKREEPDFDRWYPFAAY